MQKVRAVGWGVDREWVVGRGGLPRRFARGGSRSGLIWRGGACGVGSGVSGGVAEYGCCGGGGGFDSQDVWAERPWVCACGGDALAFGIGPAAFGSDEDEDAIG